MVPLVSFAFVCQYFICPYSDKTLHCCIIPLVLAGCAWTGPAQCDRAEEAGWASLCAAVCIFCEGGYGRGWETIGQNGPNVLKESSVFNQSSHTCSTKADRANPILRCLCWLSFPLCSEPGSGRLCVSCHSPGFIASSLQERTTRTRPQTQNFVFVLSGLNPSLGPH